MASDWPLVFASVLACLANTNNCASESNIWQKLKGCCGSEAAIDNSVGPMAASTRKAAIQRA